MMRSHFGIKEKGIPPLDEIDWLFKDENRAVDYLFQIGALYRDRTCPRCDKMMSLNLTRGKWRCPAKACRSEMGILKGSFFYKSRLACSKILQMAYFWLCQTNSATIATICGVSNHAVADFSSFFRHLVESSIDEACCKVGGPGIVVEVDETKMGKRKYHRGHRVDGVWVLGGVERTERRRMFAISVENRNAETIADVLSRFIEPGSILHTDLWRGYLNISEVIPVVHRTVNHSQTFVDTESGVHTNTIEGTWCGLKIRIPPQSRTVKNIDSCLWEFIWRRQNQRRLFPAFLHALSRVAYDE